MRRLRLGVWLASLAGGLSGCSAILQDAGPSQCPAVRIDGDFPGGNIIVEEIIADRVRLRQDIRDTGGWWFYWCFRVHSAAGRTLTFEFTDRNPIGVRGPAVSADGGGTWFWLGAEAVEGASFTYTFPAGAEDVRFAFAVPYVETNLWAFLDTHLRPFRQAKAGHPHLRVDKLCDSRKGRRVELVRLGRLDGGAARRVLLTARHHACETMASFALEGLMHSVLTDEDLAWLREEVEFFIVPFVDKDGVEDGDQGKSRTPRDHNRDYDKESIYPEVRALRLQVPAWSEGRLRFSLDMHCPYLGGGRSEKVFLVGQDNDYLWQLLTEFSAILESLPPTGLPYRAADNLPFGKEWNTAERRIEGKSNSVWAGAIPGIVSASTIEIPYANASGTAVTPESARALGMDLAKAIQKFLRACE